MKNLLLFLLLSLSVIGWGQNTILIDSLSVDGMQLYKGWKWSAGDNVEWANPEFDDSHWIEVNPSKDLRDIPQLSQKRIGWFRATLEFSPLMAQRLTTLQISQSVASEIYINGVLAKKIGIINNDLDSVQAANPTRSVAIGLPYSVSYPFVQVSIRVAYQPHALYNRVGFGMIRCLQAVVIETENVNTSRESIRYQIYYGWFQVGVSFILTFLHLAFFFLYRTQRANLYFSVTTFFLGIAFLCIPLTFSYFDYLSGYFLAELIQTISFPIAYIFLVRAIYEIYHQKIGLLYWFIVAFGILVAISLFTSYSLGSTLVELSTEFLMTAEIIRVTTLALRQKKPGARLIMIGMSLSLIMFTIFYIQLLLKHAGLENVFGIFSYQAAVLCVPMSISLYLAINFSVTNRDLIDKLQENNALTQRNLAQEQEKQQLLAAQNELLESQVKERTGQLEHSLIELKTTQAQLIQSEKLASLGELTAGIAHEIQNPLNFVNNFSELSVELIEELNGERSKVNGERNEELEGELLSDLSLNQEKINHHGKRASSIVKGMLEHSRTSTGIKEPTDINKLADEYLRLSYHGLRAKDKGRFNADFELIVNPDLPLINVIPQDMGRVLLNIINNAFQSASTAEPSNHPEEGTKKLHKVTVKTFLVEADEKALFGRKGGFSISDNGAGMSEATKAKIFQPFFTTKPTGQGTGLGLSLAYDIITKGHGGTIEVESEEGKGTTFTITIPI